MSCPSKSVTGDNRSPQAQLSVMIFSRVMQMTRIYETGTAMHAPFVFTVDFINIKKTNYIKIRIHYIFF